MRRWPIVCALAALAARMGDALAQPITNGTLDTGDPAVVALLDEVGTFGCTASVIGPHTAITAAHCVAARDPRTLRVFIGTSVLDSGDLLGVSHARIHPAFDPGGGDLAMLTFREPSPVPALALQTELVDQSLVGTIIHIVGFGYTDQGADDAGIKREGTARVAAVRTDELVVVPAPSLSCLGDSGGPALLASGAIVGVVSRGDAACEDHAVYTRVDVARSILIEPYLADTAPGTAATGDACFYDEHCAEGPCLQASDDPLLYFCARACDDDRDCPAAMTCAVDGCRYPLPSPGALGSPCEVDGDCTSRLCRDQRCTRSCAEDKCPADFECRAGSEGAPLCVAQADGCAGCATGSNTPGTLLVLTAWMCWQRRRTRALR